jgi:hypothetical protein
MKNTTCLFAGGRVENGERARLGCVSTGLYVFTVAQIFNLPVSVQIVAGHDDFAERGSVSRSTLIATRALDLSKRWRTGKAPAGHRPALLCLRLRRAALYHRFVIGKASDRSRAPWFPDDWQSATLRSSRLQVCATGVGNTVNRYKRLASDLRAACDRIESPAHVQSLAGERGFRQKARGRACFPNTVASLSACLSVAALLAFQITLTAAEDNHPPLRPPAVPLVAHDPYFSIWSPADKLTDADTVHWTGKPHRLTSGVAIDGITFRITGKEQLGLLPANVNVPAFPQTNLEVLPTRTIYTFESSGVRLTLTFMTPALPDNIDVLARPVTYVIWEARAIDGKRHTVRGEFNASPEIALNESSQAYTLQALDVEGMFVWSVGSREQTVLQKKGDDLRIDWGRFFLGGIKGSAAH